MYTSPVNINLKDVWKVWEVFCNACRPPPPNVGRAHFIIYPQVCMIGDAGPFKVDNTITSKTYVQMRAVD